VIGAIAQARAHAKQFGIDNELRVILQHCGDMHDLLIEGLTENEPLDGISARDRHVDLQPDRAAGSAGDDAGWEVAVSESRDALVGAGPARHL